MANIECALRTDNIPNLIVLGRAGIQWPSQEQLGHHAAQRPHVDGLAERQAEDDFGRPIVARLQVRIAHGFAHVRGAAKVDDFDAATVLLIVNNLRRCEQNKPNTYRYGCRVGSTSIMFSGFKSAWMSPSCFNFIRAVNTYAHTNKKRQFKINKIAHIVITSKQSHTTRSDRS